VAIQPYDERSISAPINNSNLFNAMIYPFTRMVVYGAIWYQGKEQKFDVLSKNGSSLFI
jgi:hypothetical protein